MRKTVLFLMVLVLGAAWPGSSAVAGDVGFGDPPRAEGPIGTTLTCDDTISDAEKAAVLAHIAKYPATSGRNAPPIVFDRSVTVASLTENSVFCGGVAYDVNLDDDLAFDWEETPVSGDLDRFPSWYEGSRYGENFDRICSIDKFNDTDVLRCRQKVRYKPNTDPEKGPVFQGTDSYKYTFGDWHSPSNTATITITYKPGKKPISADDYAETTAGTPVVIHVLANDTDPNGGKLAIDSIGYASIYGPIQLNKDNTITYTPLSDSPFASREHKVEFVYFVVNDVGRYSYSTVTVTIHPKPDSPAPPPSSLEGKR